MKAVLIASSISIGFALATGSASAADLLPLKSPPPIYSWTGCYIDAGVGYGMWNQNHYAETYPAPAPVLPLYTPLDLSTTTGGQGWLGRVGGGCDYQVGSSFVIGAFGDFDFMGLKGNYDDPYNYVVGNENESRAWAVGGRIGFLVTPKLLTYLDGGYTQTRFDQINLSFAGTPISGTLTGPAGAYLPATTYNGWFFGGGTEYSLWDIVPIRGVFWRTEYRFSSYQAKDLPYLSSTTGAVEGGCGGFVLDGCGEHMQKYVQTVTTGFVWKFNFGGSTPW